MVIYLGVETPQNRKKRKYTWQKKKTHVYRVAGMIASIRGKKLHLYRVVILKQMADHSLLYSVYMQKVVLVPSARIFLVLGSS